MTRRPPRSLVSRLLVIASPGLVGVTLLTGAEGCGPRRNEAAWAKANGRFSKRAEACRTDETFDEVCTSRVGDACADKVPDANVWGRWKTPNNNGTYDAELTDLETKSDPGGRSCCYSWCAPLKVIDEGAEGAPPSGSSETFCVSAPPSGVSHAAPAPYQECPSAIAPPNDAPNLGSRFSVEDTNRTRNNKTITPGPGVACCYKYYLPRVTPGRPLVIRGRERIARVVSRSFV